MPRRLIYALMLAVATVTPIRGAAAQEPEATGILFSTYLGGASIDLGQAVAIDDDGNVYVTGSTASDDFPITAGASAYRGGFSGFDVYVAKFSPDGELRYATYLGGSGDDVATSIAVDAQGRACVTGGTTSTDFPTTSASLHAYRGGGLLESDGFLACISIDGTDVDFATYLGGSGDDAVNAIAIDRNGRIYVAGSTSSDDFPTTPGAVQTTFSGGLALQTDAFAARFRRDGTGTELEYATYLGGSYDETGVSVAADVDGRLYVSGQTNSPDFPTRNPIQNAYAGPMRAFEGDGFVARINPTGSELDFATFLGGTRNEQVTGLAVDQDGNVHVAGWTQSSDFPTSSGAYQNERRGPVDGFLVKLAPTATGPWNVRYSSYLGGSGVDQAFSLALDEHGRAVIAGSTTSPNFPVREAIQSRNDEAFSDAFLTRFDVDGSELAFSTYLGGAFAEAINGVAAGSAGRICVTGGTGSGDYPLRSPLQVATRGSSSTGLAESAFVTCLGAAATGVRTEETSLDMPRRFALHANYPNPFNPTTTIQFDVKARRRVHIAVYDVAGRRVATLVDGDYAPGHYAVTVDAAGWASGVYLYRIEAGEFRQTKKMVLVK